MEIPKPWKIKHIPSPEKSQNCATPKTVGALSFFGATPSMEQPELVMNLAHQNRTIAIASDFRVDGAKSPEFPQKEGVSGSEIAARNRKSLATFHRTLKSQCSIAFSCLGIKSLRFLGSAMGIAIANRKNRCDFGALRS